MKKSDWLLLGVGVAGVYLLYRALTKGVTGIGTAAQTALTGAQTSVADVLSNLFGPAITAATGDYIATFPDGTRHAVPNNTVATDGSFTWTGYPPGSLPPAYYQLMQDATGAKYAVAAGGASGYSPATLEIGNASTVNWSY